MGRERFFIVLAVVLVVLLSGGYTWYASRPQPTAWTKVTGSTTVTDGRIRITETGWYTTTAWNLHIPNTPSATRFILVNTTVTNVGDGRAPIQGNFVVQASNDTGGIIRNAWVMINITDPPGRFPDSPIFLPAGRSVSGFLYFYMKGQEDHPNLHLDQLVYYENWYTGKDGATTFVHTELVLAPA